MLRADFLYEVSFRKDIKFVKSDWSNFIHSLKPQSYHLLREIIKSKKRFHLTPPQITHFSCIFNEFKIIHFWRGVENLRKYRPYDKI